MSGLDASPSDSALSAGSASLERVPHLACAAAHADIRLGPVDERHPRGLVPQIGVEDRGDLQVGDAVHHGIDVRVLVESELPSEHQGPAEYEAGGVLEPSPGAHGVEHPPDAGRIHGIGLHEPDDALPAVGLYESGRVGGAFETEPLQHVHAPAQEPAREPLVAIGGLPPCARIVRYGLEAGDPVVEAVLVELVRGDPVAGALEHLDVVRYADVPGVHAEVPEVARVHGGNVMLRGGLEPQDGVV